MYYDVRFKKGKGKKKRWWNKEERFNADRAKLRPGRPLPIK